MKGAIIGFVMGAGLVYVFMAYPAQSKLAVREAADKAAFALRDGAITASNAIDDKMADKGGQSPKTAKK